MGDFSPMWLDRLPRNRDVVSQYAYAKTSHDCQMNPSITKDVLIMTARTVKFVWDEAGVATVTLDAIMEAILNLLKEVSERLARISTLRPDSDVFKLFDDHVSSVGDGWENQSCISSILGSKSMNELFDVSPNDKARENAFYYDQKTSGKLRIETRLGQKSLRGDDVFYSACSGGSNMKLLVAHIGEHYQFEPGKLPTLLDVLKYVHSRVAFRKMSYSAGPGLLYTKAEAVSEAARALLAIWRGKLPQSSLAYRNLNYRVHKLVEEDEKNIKNIRHGMSFQQVEGLGLRSDFDNKHFDHATYRLQTFQEQYEQEIFFPFALPRVKRNKISDKAVSFTPNEVEVDEICPGPILVEDFDRTVKCQSFDARSWLSGKVLTHGQPGAIENDSECGSNSGYMRNFDDAIGIESFVAKEASTQTACLECPQCHTILD